MNSAGNRIHCAFASILLAAISGHAAGQAQRYSVIDLGTEAANLDAHPTGINNGGDVVGIGSTHEGYQRAIIWWGEDHTLIPRRDLNQAYDINDSGLIVGNAFFPDYGTHAYVMAGPAGEAEWLHAAFCGTWLYSTASAINAGGTIAGNVSSGWMTHAALWPAPMHVGSDLSDIDGREGAALAINSGGTLAGWISVGGIRHAFVGGPPFSDIGTLGGAGFAEGWHSEAWGINDSGVAVGHAGLPGGIAHGFRWSIPGGMSDLNPDDVAAWANAINASGTIVGGRYDTTLLAFRALAWIDGKLVDLNNRIPPGSGWELYDARDINDSGWIVGHGRVSSAPLYDHPFLLIPVDCPSDFDGSGFVDLDDFAAFVLAFEAGADNADFDGSGFVDLDDYSAFVDSFEAGC